MTAEQIRLHGVVHFKIVLGNARAAQQRMTDLMKDWPKARYETHAECRQDERGAWIVQGSRLLRPIV